MKTVKMCMKTKSGKTVSKEIEERLVSTYKAIGWEIVTETKQEKPTNNNKRNSFVSESNVSESNVENDNANN